MGHYEGMKWHRCDFQVQTPEDSRHWQDADTKLSEPRIEQDIQAKARTYLRRCHEVGLHVIGVTDHNFSSRTDPRDWFLTHLIEQNKTVAEECSRAPIVILPGFEADIGYHVLCLFDPVRKGAELTSLSDVLSTLGLAPGERFEGGLPAQLRSENAPVPLRTVLAKVQDKENGVVIAAHAFSNRGICNDAMHKADYALPGLMCVEVSDYPLEGKAKAVLEGTDAAWVREGRHPAYVRSSDAKSLAVDDERQPVANSIGYRYCWLKMSEPSIEALRQAFLDKESRISFSSGCPSDAESHPHIVSIKVKGAAFLDDQELHFSPNFNCVIGGRGSGKSSLLEYLRFCLQSERDDSLPEDIKEKHNVIRSTLQGANAEVHVTFEASPGVRDTVIIKPSEHKQYIEGREVRDLATVLEQLHAQFFSQGELTRLAKPGQNHVLRLVDAAAHDKVNALARSERDIKGELEQLGAASNRAKNVEAELQKLAQEVEELTRQWQARSDIQADARAQQLAKRASAFGTELKEQAEADVKAGGDLSAGLSGRIAALPETAAGWPQLVFLQDASQTIQAARVAYMQAVSDAATAFERVINATFGETSSWPDVSAQFDEAETGFADACRSKGLAPEDVSRLQEVGRAKDLKQSEVDIKSKQRDELRAQVAGWSDKLAALHQVWRDQFNARKLAADQIQKSAKATTISVAYMRDAESFDAAWRRLNPNNNRKRLGKNWDEIGQALFDAHARHSDVPSPWELIELWRTSQADLVDESLVLLTHFTELLAHLDSESVRMTWEQVRLTRIADLVDLELFRPDGQSAGTMSGAGGRRLSEGQRNTALLSLLLAQGRGPIVIDQPEDELDANYIFSDLVPIIRTVKSQRQLIVATHNANLPVNADAELIYAIEAKDGRGRLLAQGGLDRAQVSRAVLDVMEGSETAFKRRSEKYHF